MTEEDKTKNKEKSKKFDKNSKYRKNDKKFHNKERTDKIVCYEPKPRSIKQNKKLLKY